MTGSPEERQQLWRTQLLNLGVFREIVDVLQRQPEKAVEKDYILEMIVLRMPYENYENVFNTVIRWARFGNLFTYDAKKQRVELTKMPLRPRWQVSIQKRWDPLHYVDGMRRRQRSLRRC